MEWNMLNTDLVLHKAIVQIWKNEKYNRYESVARPDYGFLYLVKGQVTYTFADGVIGIKPGDIVYLPKGSNYEVSFDAQTGTVEDILINFDIVDDSAFAQQQEPICFYSDRCGGLYHCFNDVVHTYYEKGKSFLTNMFLYRCMDALQEAVRSGTEDEESSRLRQAANMLTEYPEITVDGICEKLHISRSVFQKNFKAYFGIPPAAYRIEKRMEKAKLLLETTDIPIKEIVDMLGFYDTAYFYKVFQKYTSLTPKQFREENKLYF